MKKVKLHFLFLFFFFSQSLFGQNGKDDFVLMNDNGFTLNDKPFFPVMFNYFVSFYKPYHGKLYVGQNHDYGRTNKFECFDEQRCLDDLYNDFVIMKELGFNSVRILGLNYGIMPFKDGTKGPGVYSKDKQINAYVDPLTPPFDELFYHIQNVLDQAQCAGIKVQLLTGGKEVDKKDYIDGYEVFLKHLVLRFNDHPALFSYDFINEPMYFHHAFNNKAEVCYNVSRWHKIIKDVAPHQWTTAGLSTSSEVFGWDPAILPVDFISFHLYPAFKEDEKIDGKWNFEASLERIKSEIYWFSKICNKPWMIGEIGFRAVANVKQEYRDVDGSLDQQYKFAKETLEFTRDLGGAGYAWWQFQDMYWGAPPEGITGDYYGVLNRSRLRKKVSSAFLKFDANQISKVDMPERYYRFYSFKNDSLEGQIKNQFSLPIQNAVINGWNKKWGSFTSTYSDIHGNFVLYSDDTINHISISAPGSNTFQKFDVDTFNIEIVLHQHPLAIDVEQRNVISNCDEIQRLFTEPVSAYGNSFDHWMIYPAIITDNFFYIKNTNEVPFQFSIEDPVGKLLLQDSITSSKVQKIMLPNLSKGSYYLKLIDVNGKTEVFRLPVYQK